MSWLGDPYNANSLRVLCSSCGTCTSTIGANLIHYLVLLVWMTCLGFWEQKDTRGYCCHFGAWWFLVELKKLRKGKFGKVKFIWRSSWAKYFRRVENENGNNGASPKGRSDFFKMGQDLLRTPRPEIVGNFLIV